MELFGRRERFGSHFGLERIELVCRGLGNPQDDLKFIHLAGTNGKGSVAAYLAKVLQESGLKVGLFISPHLEAYEERFQINGVQVQNAVLAAAAERTERAIDQVEKDHPELGSITEFELATAVGFLCFKECGVDIVVLETGLGGRLDATNIVLPELTVITTIGHDHTNRLGESLVEIAREKGGIIKRNVPVVSGVSPGRGEDVLRTIAAGKNAPWHTTDQVSWRKLGWDLNGGRLFFPRWGEMEVGLVGEHQLENAATALLALEQLAELGWPVSQKAVVEGMANTHWPGRLEVVSRDPLLLLDGSHNPEGIAALARSLTQLKAGLATDKFTFVFGMLENKDLELIDPLIPLANRFVFTAAESGRFAPKDPGLLKEYARERGAVAIDRNQPAQALREALEGPPVCVCGSLYLVGTIKRVLRQRTVIIG